MKNHVFKQCSNCHKSWDTRDEFLSDSSVKLFGYQASPEKLEAGLFHFYHSCNNTILIYAEVFTHLYDGLIFTDNLSGTDKCAEYCLHKYELGPCPNKCECAYVREILQTLRGWPKKK